MPQKKLNISRKHNALWSLFSDYGVLLISIVKGFVFVPLYLDYIDSDLYGYWLAMASVTIWLSAADPGFSDVIRQQTAKMMGKKAYSRVSSIAVSSFVLGMVFTCGMGVAGLVMIKYIKEILDIQNILVANTIKEAFKMVVAGNMMMLLAFSFSAVSQGMQQGKGCGVISLLANILSVIVIYVRLINGQGILALASGLLVCGGLMLLGQGCFAVWNLKVIREPFTFSFIEFSKLWKLSWINFVGKISRVVSDSIDNLLLVRMIGPGQVLIYELTRRGPLFCGAFFSRIGNAVSAPIAHLHGEGSPEQLRYWGLKIMQAVFWLLAAFIGCFLALNQEFISLWVGEQFYAGFICNSFVILWISTLLVMKLFNILVLYTGSIAESSKVNIVYTMLLVPAIVIGIKLAGIVGLVVGGFTATALVLYFYQWPSFQRAFNFRKQERLALGREFLSIIPPVIVSVLILNRFYVDSWFLFFGKTTACFATVVCMLAVFSREFTNTFLVLVKTRNFFKRSKKIS